VRGGGGQHRTVTRCWRGSVASQAAGCAGSWEQQLQGQCWRSPLWQTAAVRHCCLGSSCSKNQQQQQGVCSLSVGHLLVGSFSGTAGVAAVEAAVATLQAAACAVCGSCCRSWCWQLASCTVTALAALMVRSYPCCYALMSLTGHVASPDCVPYIRCLGVSCELLQCSCSLCGLLAPVLTASRR
jgi:hypothetical protein